MRLVSAIWLWGGTVIVAICSLTLLLLLRGETRLAGVLLTGIILFTLFVHLMARRLGPSEREEE